MPGRRFSEVRIEVVPPMRVACFRAISATPEDEAAQHLRQWMSIRGLPAGRVFGFDVPVPPEPQRHGLRGYEVWGVIPPDAGPSGGTTVRGFPGGLYAVMTIHDAFDDPFTLIPEGWTRLSKWVGSSAEYHEADHQHLEEIVKDGRARHLAIYYPVTAGWIASAA